MSVFCRTLVLCLVIGIAYIKSTEATKYQMSSRLVNWIDAQDQCHQTGQKLATIPNEQAAKQLKKWLRRSGDNASAYWIGGIYLANPQCEAENTVKACWKWVDVNAEVTGDIDPDQTGFEFYGNTHGTFNSRATLYRDMYNKAYISSAENTSTLKFICET